MSEKDIVGMVGAALRRTGMRRGDGAYLVKPAHEAARRFGCAVRRVGVFRTRVTVEMERGGVPLPAVTVPLV